MHDGAAQSERREHDLSRFAEQLDVWIALAPPSQEATTAASMPRSLRISRRKFQRWERADEEPHTRAMTPRLSPPVGARRPVSSSSRRAAPRYRSHIIDTVRCGLLLDLAQARDATLDGARVPAARAVEDLPGGVPTRELVAASALHVAVGPAAGASSVGVVEAEVSLKIDAHTGARLGAWPLRRGGDEAPLVRRSTLEPADGWQPGAAAHQTDEGSWPRHRGASPPTLRAEARLPPRSRRRVRLASGT